MKYFLIPLFLAGLVGSTFGDSTIPSSTISEVDFTASTFADEYRELLQKGGQQVSVLIKVVGEPESTDPTKRAKEIRNLQSSILKFLSFSNGVNIVSDKQKNEITGQIHPHWIEIIEKRSDVLSIQILGQFEYSSGKAVPPLKQMRQGIPLSNIVCNNDLVLIKKYDGNPSCVKPETKQKLIERGWTLDTSVIDSFEDCVAAGNPVMESYPRQCRTLDGKHFVEEISPLDVIINGDSQVRRGTTQTIEIQVLRDEIPVPGAQVFIDIEDYGEDLYKEFDGYTNSQGILVFSWEIPQSFDDIETLLAIIDVTDDISAKTELFKFQVYCLPIEQNCKVEGN